MAVGTERPVDFVGRDVQETEAIANAVGCFACRLQQVMGADDVGVDEFRGAADAAVDMAFGGQVHDRVGLNVTHRVMNGRFVAKVGVDELVVRVMFDVRQRLGLGGVGQGVEVDDSVAEVHGGSDEVVADEAAAAGDEEGFQLAGFSWQGSVGSGGFSKWRDAGG